MKLDELSMDDSAQQWATYGLPHKELAARMFSRWCQENFFGYMMHHFAIDLLAEYGTEDLPAHQEVIKPTWRELTKLKNSIQNKLKYRQARFGEMTTHPKVEEDTKRYRKWVQKGRSTGRNPAL